MCIIFHNLIFKTIQIIENFCNLIITLRQGVPSEIVLFIFMYFCCCECCFITSRWNSVSAAKISTLNQYSIYFCTGPPPPIFPQYEFYIIFLLSLYLLTTEPPTFYFIFFKLHYLYFIKCYVQVSFCISEFILEK